jgi:hypothetical protein
MSSVEQAVALVFQLGQQAIRPLGAQDGRERGPTHGELADGSVEIDVLDFPMASHLGPAARP